MSDGFVSSDGSLTQDEIDALLGGDSGSSPTPSAAPEPAPAPVMSAGGASGPLNSSQVSAITGLLSEVVTAQSATLSGMVGSNITISNPRISVLGKEEFLQNLSDEIVETQVNFNSGLSGSHSVIMQLDAAMKLAEPMIGHEELLEMDDTAVNVIQEAVSMMSGSAMTSMGDRTGMNLMTDPAESSRIPKAMLMAPGDDFGVVTYQLNIEGAGNFSLYEIFDTDNLIDLAKSLGADSSSMDMGGVPDMDAIGSMGSPAAGMGMNQNQMNMGQGQMGMNQNQMGMNQMGMGQMGMGQMGMGMPQGQMGMGQMGMGMPQGQMGMGQMGMPMGGFMGTQPPSVQGINYPSFEPSGPSGEQGNISLLMDVYMEVTVELGRTKKQIKDILGMGEGTIIELDKLAGEAVDILVNGHLIAKGEVVVIDENFGVRVTDIVSSLEGKLAEP